MKNTNKYRDLEDRATTFAKEVNDLCKSLPHDRINNRLIDQLVRAAGSVGANYREANEAVSKRDFAYRIRISRKEVKESRHWLELVAAANSTVLGNAERLSREADELRNIFSAILSKVTAVELPTNS